MAKEDATKKEVAYESSSKKKQPQLKDRTSIAYLMAHGFPEHIMCS
jgi:hypothetical protein